MRSDKQKAASRANGAKSQGPVTPEGKAISSKNAERHNLCASAPLVILSGEEVSEFLQVQDDYIVRFQPVDGVELDLVFKLVAASWRERRITGMETALFELEMVQQKEKVDDEYLDISPTARQALALTGKDDTKSAAALLLRYASNARRAYTSTLKALKEVQGERFNRRTHAAPPAERPLKYPACPDANPSTKQEPEPATVDAPAAAARRHHPAVATFIVLRRRIVNRAAQAENIELPNEPKLRALAAGATHPLAA